MAWIKKVAEEKVCPFIRGRHATDWNSGAKSTSPSHINCITDRCMAWIAFENEPDKGKCKLLE